MPVEIEVPLRVFVVRREQHPPSRLVQRRPAVLQHRFFKRVPCATDLVRSDQLIIREDRSYGGVDLIERRSTKGHGYSRMKTGWKNTRRKDPMGVRPSLDGLKAGHQGEASHLKIDVLDV